MCYGDCVARISRIRKGENPLTGGCRVAGFQRVGGNVLAHQLADSFIYTPLHLIRKVHRVLSADGESKERASKPRLAASPFFAGFAVFHRDCI